MAEKEKVEKLGLKRDKNFLYYVKGSDVYKVPAKKAGGPSVKGKGERIHQGSFKREDGYLYFLDKAGDVGRSKRAVGGQKRKKKAAPKKAKKAAKKPAKKAPAKKAAAKKKKK